MAILVLKPILSRVDCIQKWLSFSEKKAEAERRLNQSEKVSASGLLIEDEFTYMWQMLCVFPLWLPITSLGHLEVCSMLEVFSYISVSLFLGGIVNAY